MCVFCLCAKVSSCVQRADTFLILMVSARGAVWMKQIPTAHVFVYPSLLLHASWRKHMDYTSSKPPFAHSRGLGLQLYKYSV